MNQKGFATILGLCLILAIALVVKGIQESEGNHAYETTDFQTEYDLQNAAESGIYMAAADVKKNPLPLNKLYEQATYFRKKNQFNVIKNKPIKTSSGEIIVNVWAERLVIIPYEVNYKDKAATPSGSEKISYAFFSKAELTSPRTGGKLYRRAFAYVLKDDNTWTIHFMKVATGDYKYAD